MARPLQYAVSPRLNKSDEPTPSITHRACGTPHTALFVFHCTATAAAAPCIHLCPCFLSVLFRPSLPSPLWWRVQELERRIASVIRQSFEDTPNIAGQFKLLDSFHGLLSRTIVSVCAVATAQSSLFSCLLFGWCVFIVTCGLSVE